MSLIDSRSLFGKDWPSQSFPFSVGLPGNPCYGERSLAQMQGNLIEAMQPRDTNQSLSLVAAAIRDILMSGVRREESTFLGCGKSEEFGNVCRSNS